MRVQVMLIAAMLVVAVAAVRVHAQEEETARVTDGLVALYEFVEGDGDIVKDSSGVGEQFDLKISDMDKALWVADGGLLIFGEGVALRSEQPSTKIFEALKAANAVTIEAEISPKDDVQEGPARIVSLSRDTGARNFTLGQTKTQYILRLRTTETDRQGMPEVMTDEQVVEARRQHVVVTYGAEKVCVYVDGELKKEQERKGDLANWDESHGFVIANENTLDRSWLGQIYLVAVYDRALTAEEVQQNFAALERPTEASAE